MKKIILLVSIFITSGCSVVTESTDTPPTLQKAYENYFDIGVAVTSKNLDTLIDYNLIDEYSTLTAEYEMKWDQVQLNKETYFFDNCDSIYEFAIENNKTIRGHTLVWRTNVPSFIYDIAYSNNSNEEKMEEVLQLIKEYYVTMNQRYPGAINVWDIANEVIEDYNDYIYRYDNIYYQMFNYNDEVFEEFIAKVFIMVKEISPNVSRYYNDYFLITDPIKRNKVITFINNINKLGADVQGVGMQSHITTSVTKQQIDDAIKDFRDNDLLISFTELDISIYEDDSIAPTLPMSFNSNSLKLEDYDDKLSKTYNHVFSAARENSDIVENITFWGIADIESWLVKDFYNYRTDFPLLFDDYYMKKKCYYIVKDFELYKGGN